MTVETNTTRHMRTVIDAVDHAMPIRVYGKVTEVIGLLIESTGPAASIGDVCRIERGGETVGMAEVVGFREKRTLLMPLGPIEGIHPGLTVVGTKRPLMANVGPHLLGRVLDGLGQPARRQGTARQRDAPAGLFGDPQSARPQAHRRGVPDRRQVDRRADYGR